MLCPSTRCCAPAQVPPLYEVPGQQPHEADDNRDVQFGLETLATLREHLRSLQVGRGHWVAAHSIQQCSSSSAANTDPAALGAGCIALNAALL